MRARGGRRWRGDVAGLAAVWALGAMPAIGTACADEAKVEPLATLRVSAGPAGAASDEQTRALLRAIAYCVNRSEGGAPDRLNSGVQIARLLAAGQSPLRAISLTSLRTSEDGARRAWSVELQTDGALSSEAIAQLRAGEAGGLIKVGRKPGAGGDGDEVIEVQCATDASAFALSSPRWGEVPSVWPAHDAALARAQPAIKGSTIFDVRVDLSALRRAAPAMFFAPPTADLSREGASPRAHEILRALGLASARSIGLRGTRVASANVRLADVRGVPDSSRGAAYIGPDLVRLDLTHASRSGAVNDAARVAITTGFWPAELTTLAPVDASWAMVVRCDQGGPGMSEFGSGVVGWSRWISGVWVTMTSPGERDDALRRLSAWQLSGGGMIRSASQTMGRWAVVWPLAIIAPADEGIGVIRLAAVCPMRTPVNLTDVAKTMTRLGASLGAIAITPADGLLAGWSLRWTVGGTAAGSLGVEWTATAGVFGRDAAHAEMFVGVLAIGGSADSATMLRQARDATRAMPAAISGDGRGGGP